MIAIASLRISAATIAAILFVYAGFGEDLAAGRSWTTAVLSLALLGGWAVLPFFIGRFRGGRRHPARVANRLFFFALLAVTAWFTVVGRAPAWIAISEATLSFVVWNTTTFLLFHDPFNGTRNAALPASLVRRYLAGLATMAGAGAVLAATAEGARQLLQSVHAGIPAPVLLICAAAVAVSVRRLVVNAGSDDIDHDHQAKPVPQRPGQR